MKKKSDLDFETCIKNLEEIVLKLESGEESLESSLGLYDQGIKISNECEKILSDAKQKIATV